MERDEPGSKCSESNGIDILSGLKKRQKLDPFFIKYTKATTDGKKKNITCCRAENTENYPKCDCRG